MSKFLISITTIPAFIILVIEKKILLLLKTILSSFISRFKDKSTIISPFILEFSTSILSLTSPFITSLFISISTLAPTSSPFIKTSCLIFNILIYLKKR